MSEQNIDQEGWGEAELYPDGYSIQKLIAVRETILMLAWFVIGGLFTLLTLEELLYEYNVEISLLLLLLIGQGALTLSYHYLRQIKQSQTTTLQCENRK